MQGNLKREKYCITLGSQNPSSKREMAGVKHQRLDTDIPGAQMYLVSLHVPLSLRQLAHSAALERVQWMDPGLFSTA